MNNQANNAGYTSFSSAQESLKILVVGATGGTGRATVEKLLCEGHYVTAFSRSADVLMDGSQQLKHWPEIFNNDSTITSAVLDRLLHHAQTIVIEGQSYRMKDQIEP